MNDDDFEQMLNDKGLNAPRVTPELINNKIQDVDYHRLPNTLITVCVITLENGFTVTGESACASPENFDQKAGQMAAYRNAYNKIWPLEGYLLKQRLFDDTYDLS